MLVLNLRNNVDYNKKILKYAKKINILTNIMYGGNFLTNEIKELINSKFIELDCIVQYFENELNQVKITKNNLEIIFQIEQNEINIININNLNIVNIEDDLNMIKTLINQIKIIGYNISAIKKINLIDNLHIVHNDISISLAKLWIIMNGKSFFNHNEFVSIDFINEYRNNNIIVDNLLQLKELLRRDYVLLINKIKNNDFNVDGIINNIKIKIECVEQDILYNNYLTYIIIDDTIKTTINKEFDGYNINYYTESAKSNDFNQVNIKLGSYKTCIILTFYENFIYVDYLSKCKKQERFGKDLLEKIKNVAIELSNIKYIALEDESSITLGSGFYCEIDLATLYILKYGTSWYNKFNFYSSKHDDERLYNETIRNKKLIDVLNESIELKTQYNLSELDRQIFDYVNDYNFSEKKNNILETYSSIENYENQMKSNIVENNSNLKNAIVRFINQSQLPNINLNSTMKDLGIQFSASIKLLSECKKKKFIYNTYNIIENSDINDMIDLMREIMLLTRYLLKYNRRYLTFTLDNLRL